MASPIDTIASGKVVANIWENTTGDGGIYYSIQLQRAPSEEGGDWGQRFYLSDTPHLVVVAIKLSFWKGPGEDGEESSVVSESSDEGTKSPGKAFASQGAARTFVKTVADEYSLTFKEAKDLAEEVIGPLMQYEGTSNSAWTEVQASQSF